MFRRGLTAIVITAAIAGCGDEQMVETQSAGKFISSERFQGETYYTTITDTAIFRTYTSLLVPKQTPVILERHMKRNGNDKDLDWQILLALGQSVKVESIVAMAP